MLRVVKSSTDSTLLDTLQNSKGSQPSITPSEGFSELLKTLDSGMILTGDKPALIESQGVKEGSGELPMSLEKNQFGHQLPGEGINVEKELEALASGPEKSLSPSEGFFEQIQSKTDKAPGKILENKNPVSDIENILLESDDSFGVNARNKLLRNKLGDIELIKENQVLIPQESVEKNFKNISVKPGGKQIPLGKTGDVTVVENTISASEKNGFSKTQIQNEAKAFSFKKEDPLEGILNKSQEMVSPKSQKLSLYQSEASRGARNNIFERMIGSKESSLQTQKSQLTEDPFVMRKADSTPPLKHMNQNSLMMLGIASSPVLAKKASISLSDLKVDESQNIDNLSQQIYDYIRKNAPFKTGSIDVHFSHDTVGDVRMNVTEVERGVFQITVSSSDEMGMEFFKSHKGKILDTLTSSGLQVKDFNISKDSNSWSFNKDQQQHAYEGNSQRRDDSEKRRELWNLFENQKEAA